MIALIYNILADMIDLAGLSPHAVLTDILITRHDEPLTRAGFVQNEDYDLAKEALADHETHHEPDLVESGPGAKDASGGKRGPTGRKL